MADLSPESLAYIVDNVVLPPKLPGFATAEDTTASTQALLSLLNTQLKAFLGSISPKENNYTAWIVVQKMLLSMYILNSSAKLSPDLLRKALQTMRPNDVLVLPLRAQNAILILRMDSSSTQFECSEACPQAAQVLGTKGPLVRRFPAHAVSIPSKIFKTENFMIELVRRLCQMDAEKIREMSVPFKKGGSSVELAEDSSDPYMVSDMLMALLAALGKPVTVKQVTKRFRDDILGTRGKRPWRRSPLWLAIKIAIQTTLMHNMDVHVALIQYKSFMVFWLAEIALQASNSTHEEAVDLSRITTIKLARRMAKLGQSCPAFVEQRASECSAKIQQWLQNKWEGICLADGSRASTIADGPFFQHTALSLSNSKEYIESVIHRTDVSMVDAGSAFNPCSTPLLSWVAGLPCLQGLSQSKSEKMYALMELECWVSKNIRIWVQDRLTAPKAEDCHSLAQLATSYFTTASEIYGSDQLLTSEMVLTLLDVWLAIDVLAIRLTPLMKDYSPEIEPAIFNPLLLPRLEQMQRLCAIEEHLTDRIGNSKNANKRNPSMFCAPGESGSFTVEFYSSSAKHQRRKKRIEEDARKSKAAKKAEHDELSQRYNKLKNDADLLSCATERDDDEIAEHVATDCRKCQLNTEADAMGIEVLEWPLPAKSSVVSSVIVELECPWHISAWREITWILVHDIGRKGGVSGRHVEVKLEKYEALHEYYKSGKPRLTLASAIKPAVDGPDGRMPFPVESDLCSIVNRLQFEVFDNRRACWVKDQRQAPSIRDQCTPSLPQGPYSNLQWALPSTEHSQNAVIAAQDSCHPSLSLQEFISFGSLRSDGERVQLMNVKRELSATHLNLNAPEVVTLFRQAVWQAGSAGDCALRNTHVDLRDLAFGSELLTAIKERFKSVSQNWKSDHVVSLFVTLVQRVLSLTPHTHVRHLALEILDRIRSATYQWTTILSAMLAHSDDPKQNDLVSRHLLRAALLCKMTFDVEDQHLPDLIKCSQNVRSWVVCSIRINENIPENLETLPEQTRGALVIDKRLSLLLCHHIQRRVIADPDNCFDDALKVVYDAYQSPASLWNALAEPNQRWVVADIADPRTTPSYKLHYNILEGKLLIDGMAHGRLPAQYTCHAQYKRILGSQILRVFPSKMDIMQYTTSQRISGYSIQFGFAEDELIVRAVKNSRVMELLPHHQFEGDLPYDLVHHYTHWFDLESHVIEFRPLHSPWVENSSNWRLDLRHEKSPLLKRGERLLVDLRSETHAAIVNVLGALDGSQHVIATYSKQNVLEIALPRYDLNFVRHTDGSLECKELGKTVDRNQHLGTMVGLKNRLVLSGVKPYAQKFDRQVLIPEGEVSLSKVNGHVQVEISHHGNSARLYQYAIDPILGRLTDSSEPREILYKAYLHAVTSYTLPDPLTKYTGTEEALLYLQKRSLSFVKPPDETTVRLLSSIANLTPSRDYYPAGLKVMQQVKWNPTLSFFSQHDEYLVHADRIQSSGQQFLHSASRSGRDAFTIQWKRGTFAC